MPMLTYPLALLGLAAMPGLVAIYFLRRRFQRREVTGIFLWSALARAEQGGRRVERFRTPLLFFLELLILGALALAATDLRHLASRPVRPVVLILDDSYSMRAVTGGQSARVRGLAAIRREMERYQPTSVRVIVAGAEPRLAGVPMPVDRALALAEDRWDCLAPEANLVSALTLAAEVSEADAWVLVVTDHVPDGDLDAPRRLWLSVGQQAANAAFIAARRSRLDAENDRCFLQVANPGSLPVESKITVTGDGQPLGLARPLSLAPGATERMAFSVPRATQVVRGSLGPDALATDNEVILLPPREHRVRVANLIGDPDLRKLVGRALAASGLREPGVGPPGLVIADSSLGRPSSRRWTFEIDVPKSPVPFTGPFVADWGHRLMQGLDFSGVVWAGRRGVKPAGQPVVMAGNTSLVEDREVAGGHAFRMYLDVTSSTVSRTPNWPALFWNLLAWRAEHHPGFVEAQVRMGHPARLLLPPIAAGSTGSEDIELESPTGRKRVLPRPSTAELPVAASTPGVYSARVGEHTYRFACNPLSPAEGDMSGCRPVRLGGRLEGGALRREYASGAWLFGLLACALLLLHTFLLRSRSPVPATQT